MSHFKIQFFNRKLNFICLSSFYFLFPESKMNSSDQPLSWPISGLVLGTCLLGTLILAYCSFLTVHLPIESGLDIYSLILFVVICLDFCSLLAILFFKLTKFLDHKRLNFWFLCIIITTSCIELPYFFVCDHYFPQECNDPKNFFGILTNLVLTSFFCLIIFAVLVIGCFFLCTPKDAYFKSVERIRRYDLYNL